jgi:glucose-6-phosphate-specific signal transduction histidine kinase
LSDDGSPRLAQEQAALRRVATLVARGAPPKEVFAAVTEEVGVRLAVRDDGDGGADPARGSGLTGLGDRIEALGGTLHITSPPGAGTTLLIQIPATRHHAPGPPGP